MHLLTTVGAKRLSYDRYLFVIDTDTPTDVNEPFGTQLTAWVTGRYDTDTNGTSIADAALAEAGESLDWTENVVDSEPNIFGPDEGVYQHHCIVRTPGYWSDGYGHVFTTANRPADGSAHFPANQSVAVLFQRALTLDEQAQLRARARFFLQHFVQDDTGADAALLGCEMDDLPAHRIGLVGFRVLMEEVRQTCTAVYRAED